MKPAILVLIAVATASAQTQAIKDPFRVIGTNVVVAKGKDWVHFGGTVVGVHPDGIRVDGSFYSDGYARTFTGDFFVSRWPYKSAEGDLVAGVTAIKSGTHTYSTMLRGPRTLHNLDYGEIYIPPPPAPPSEEQKAAARAASEKKKSDTSARALKWNQDQAAAGDAYGQFRMGQRYLAGDGVQKDDCKAIEMFDAAARQGHREAAAVLQQITRTNPAAPPKK